MSLDEAVIRWTTRSAGDRKAITVGNEFGVVRQLCLYRRRRDPASYVPEHALAPIKESVFLPYIFTHDEVRALLAAGTAHKGRFIGACMLRALILLLYCTGMRLGEAVRLQMADIDLARGTLMIQHSKGRSRVVAIRVDLVGELQHYIDDRRALVARARCADPSALLLRLNATALTIKSASDALRRLLRKLGMKPPSGRTGARPYEFRHNSGAEIIPSAASNDAAVPEVTSWAGCNRCPGLSAALQEIQNTVAGSEARYRDLLGSCIGERALLQLHVRM